MLHLSHSYTYTYSVMLTVQVSSKRLYKKNTILALFPQFPKYEDWIISAVNVNNIKVSGEGIFCYELGMTGPPTSISLSLFSAQM